MRLVIFGGLRITKKQLLLFMLVCLAALAVFGRAAVQSVASLRGLPLTGKTVAIDPGHGGYDPGVIRDEIEEKKVVLEIALKLRNYLQGAGARVVMTRETDRDLLVLPTAGPKKQQDMQNRLKVLEEASPDLVISVHANAIDSPRWSGAQVFYKINCEESKRLAAAIQAEMKRVLKNTERVEKPGDYLILYKAGAPAVLVETGFISNPGEARLLIDKEYQTKVAWSIYLGILSYLDEASNR